MSEPVRVRQRRLIGENSRFHIYFDDVEDRSGRRVEDFLSVTPKGVDARRIGGVAVLPVHEGRIGLMRIYRHTLGRWGYEIVKGFMEPGEDPMVAARREYEEEARLSASTAIWVPLGTTAPDSSVIEALVLLYAAIGAGAAAMLPSTDDLAAAELEWLDWSKILDMSADGDLIDAVSLVCLFRAAHTIGPWSESWRKISNPGG
jgi:ADP-ribose pyrophosphatase